MSDRILRGSLALIGVCLTGYGVLRLLQLLDAAQLTALAVWLGACLLLHDGLLAPAEVGIGFLLSKLIPTRARAFVQYGLVSGGLVAAVAGVLIWRRGRVSAASLSLLNQNYTLHLTVLLGLILLATTVCYLAAVWRCNRTNSRAPDDQTSVADRPTDLA
jgi:hypothetical protein